MRKRLVIGAIAAVVLGIAAYVLWEPRSGTVEYHKARERKARNALGQHGFLEENAPKFIDDAIWRFRNRRLQRHQRALMRLGYLGELKLVASNAPTEVVMSRSMSFPGVDVEFSADKREIKVICPVEDMEAIRRAFTAADVDDATWDKIIQKR